MSTESGSKDPTKPEQTWTPEVDDHDTTPEIPSELTLDGEIHTPEEAGYGYGV